MWQIAAMKLQKDRDLKKKGEKSEITQHSQNIQKLKTHLAYLPVHKHFYYEFLARDKAVLLYLVQAALVHEMPACHVCPLSAYLM